MRLILHCFKCYGDEQIVDLASQGLTLIKGPSGSGKSSILAALAWVLYGGLRNVASQGGGQCWVRLECESLVIYRQKKPELLQVLHDGVIHEGEAAQAIINQYFGSKEVWWGSCYLAQSTRHALLELSNIEKMQLLTSLAFGDDQPDHYLQRLDEELGVSKKALRTKEDRYKRLHAQVELLETQFKPHAPYL